MVKVDLQSEYFILKQTGRVEQIFVILLLVVDDSMFRLQHDLGLFSNGSTRVRADLLIIVLLIRQSMDLLVVLLFRIVR